ncbi:hypothetical protein F7725_011248 [Dissostichus mawsoni]|uniref:Uncharacterized protein n=1 Tax=Dissostichus mawsoni TaxID=36200 RepID=A0A7J5ZBK3_DISMA|nr:hypothetical protein F7725_011248 [Dissostichus mawsoni]
MHVEYSQQLAVEDSNDSGALQAVVGSAALALLEEFNKVCIHPGSIKVLLDARLGASSWHDDLSAGRQNGQQKGIVKPLIRILRVAEAWEVRMGVGRPSRAVSGRSRVMTPREQLRKMTALGEQGALDEKHWYRLVNGMSAGELRQRQELIMRNQMAMAPQILAQGQQRLQGVPAQFEPRFMERSVPDFTLKTETVALWLRAS